MAYNLQLNNPRILKGPHRELSWRNQQEKISLLKGRISTSQQKSSDHQKGIKIIRFSTRDSESRGIGKGFNNVRGLQCCCCTSTSSSTSSSSSSAEELEMAALEMIEKEEGKYCASQMREKFSVLCSENGWQVRRMVEAEADMRTVARVQAAAFHEPVILFDDLFFEFFQAEVLSGLLYKLRNSAPDRYACLVAEPSRNSVSASETKDLVGVTDCTVLRDDGVLQHLPGADEYLYVSGIAVLKKFRRQKVATALLKACDTLSRFWGFEYTVLRAYEDDWGARKLYANAGYKVVASDPAWTSTWIGRRRRVLMIKRCRDNTIGRTVG